MSKDVTKELLIEYLKGIYLRIPIEQNLPIRDMGEGILFISQTYGALEVALTAQYAGADLGKISLLLHLQLIYEWNVHDAAAADIIVDSIKRLHKVGLETS